jgi:hypothetical protein
MDCLRQGTATIGEELAEYVARPMKRKYPLTEYALMPAEWVS